MDSYQRLNRPGALRPPKSMQNLNSSNLCPDNNSKLASYNSLDVSKPTSNIPLVLSKRDINRIIPHSSHITGTDSCYVVAAGSNNSGHFSDSDDTISRNRKRKNHEKLKSDSHSIIDSYSADNELDDEDDDDIIAIDLDLHGEDPNPSAGSSVKRSTTSDLTTNSRVVLKSTAITSAPHSVDNEQKLIPLPLPTSIPTSVEQPAYTQNVHVQIKPQGEPLLSNQARLLLQSISRSPIQEASPFFRSLEYNPSCPTYETILLSILEDEISLIDSDNNSNSNTSLWSIVTRFFYRLTHFGDLNGEEYLQKYPWEKYYDLADWLLEKHLFENDVEPGIHAINEEMAPVGYDFNPLGGTTMKRSYEYIIKSQE